MVDHQTRVPAQHLGATRRQMELAAPYVDPHDVRSGHHVGVARKTERADVECRRKLLIRHQHVDVFEADDVTDILGGAVVSRRIRFLDHGCGPSARNWR